MPPVGLIGLCAPDFQGDVAAARASAATGVPFTLSTFSQAPMEDVIKHAGATPNFFQLYLPGDRELAASFLDRAESSGYSSLVVTVDSWTLGYRPAISRSETIRKRAVSAWRTTTPTKISPNISRSHHTKIRRRLCALRVDLRAPLSWEDLRWIVRKPNFLSR